MSTRAAACSCGQFRLEVEGDPIRISVCHCLACQRRTGSAFGAQARFPADRRSVPRWAVSGSVVREATIGASRCHPVRRSGAGRPGPDVWAARRVACCSTGSQPWPGSTLSPGQCPRQCAVACSASCRSTVSSALPGVWSSVRSSGIPSCRIRLTTVPSSLPLWRS